MDAPDLKQCQAEKPNGATFMTFGGVPKLVRCTAKPTVIITEAKAGSDGKVGSMSVCESCLEAAKTQLGEAAFTVSPIRRLSRTQKLKAAFDQGKTITSYVGNDYHRNVVINHYLGDNTYSVIELELRDYGIKIDGVPVDDWEPEVPEKVSIEDVIKAVTELYPQIHTETLLMYLKNLISS